MKDPSTGLVSFFFLLERLIIRNRGSTNRTGVALHNFKDART